MSPGEGREGRRARFREEFSCTLLAQGLFGSVETGLATVVQVGLELLVLRSP